MSQTLAVCVSRTQRKDFGQSVATDCVPSARMATLGAVALSNAKEDRAINAAGMGCVSVARQATAPARVIRTALEVFGLARRVACVPADTLAASVLNFVQVWTQGLHVPTVALASKQVVVCVKLATAQTVAA